MSTPLTNGRHAGFGPPLKPRTRLTANDDGSLEVRVDCDNRPEFWVIVQITDEQIEEARRVRDQALRDDDAVREVPVQDEHPSLPEG